MYSTISIARRAPLPGGPDLRGRIDRPVRRLRVTLLLAPLAVVALWAAVRSPASSPHAIYTVAAFTDRLAHAHTSWIGRTVWVRGDVVTRTERLDQPGGDAGLGFTQMYLVDPVAPRDIFFEAGPPNPLYALLRSLPLIGRLTPPPQSPRIGVSADYEVHLQVLPCLRGYSCDAAILLDADPRPSSSVTSPP